MREGKGVSYPVKQMDEVTLSRSHALTLLHLSLSYTTHLLIFDIVWPIDFVGLSISLIAKATASFTSAFTRALA